jgi:signal transduction histidine kinase
MESFIAPLSQELVAQDDLSPESRDRLTATLEQGAVAERILSVKIWKEGGYLAYASDPDLIGQRFEPTSSLIEAWSGRMISDFDDLDHAESEGERASGVPLVEVYNPIHSIKTGEIIAVAEFYQNAHELQNDLRSSRLSAWAVVAAVASLTFLTLFGIVRAGSQTIQRQHGELRDRIDEVTRVSNQNDLLRQRIQGASERAAALNEQLLRRIGAELHDGPAQALALANLRIASLNGGSPSTDRDNEVREIHNALESALTDIRGLARGLVLPELEGLSIPQVIHRAADAHAARSQTDVALEGRDEIGLERAVGLPHLICIYRFVQEGLTNAWRHAAGNGQIVTWNQDGDDLLVTVCDEGPGFEPEKALGRGRLGLEGLRERVQSAGGEFHVHSRSGHGTCLTMRLPLPGASE